LARPVLVQATKNHRPFTTQSYAIGTERFDVVKSGFASASAARKRSAQGSIAAAAQQSCALQAGLGIRSYYGLVGKLKIPARYFCKGLSPKWSVMWYLAGVLNFRSQPP
jgi:hypothetical protein